MHHADMHLAVVETNMMAPMDDNVCRLYEVGRQRPNEADSDIDDAHSDSGDDDDDWDGAGDDDEEEDDDSNAEGEQDGDDEDHDSEDELGSEDEEIVTVDANTFEVDGGLRIEEANEELELDLPTGDYETVAGFILSHLGRIPKQGEHLKYRDLKLAIIEMQDRKIERVLVTKEQDATPAS